jgi:hypothetical protein
MEYFSSPNATAQLQSKKAKPQWKFAPAQN